jgi:very-short-patch-repair endonuclease
MRTFLISRQKINPEKLTEAKRFRKQMTQAETAFWELVRNNKVHGFHFRRQQVIAGFIADFFCNQLKLIVEIDGGVHEQQKNYDVERERIISLRGLTIVRFSNAEIIYNLNTVKQRLELTINSITAPSTAEKGI